MFDDRRTYGDMIHRVLPPLCEIAAREFACRSGSYAECVDFDETDAKQIRAAAKEIKRLLCAAVDAEADKEILFSLRIST